MNTELENKELFEGKDRNSIKIEKMRYQKNSLSYMLGFGGVLCSVFGAFVLLNSLTPGIYSIFKILMNIVILLFGFMCCENVKNYRKKSAYMMLGISGVCAARIFFGPILLFSNYAKYLTYMEAGELTDVQNAEVSKWLGSSIMEKSGFLTPSGYVRGTIAIVLLVASVVFFALSAVICIIKANKLQKFLASEKK